MMSTNNDTTGDWIKTQREMRGLTQRGLAELADVHWTSLSAVERGDREATSELIIKLAQAFNSTSEELIVQLAVAGIWKKRVVTQVNGEDDWWLSQVKLAARGANRRTLKTAVRTFKGICEELRSDADDTDGK